MMSNEQHKTPISAPVDSFQGRVQPWMMACFGAEISADGAERNHRFLEESLELVQACSCTASEAHQLVDYVYGRPVGERAQEVGGVMVTLAALCLAQGLDMQAAGETELARIWTKVEAIRAKQAAKPKHSPLPAAAPQVVADERAGFEIWAKAEGLISESHGIRFTNSMCDVAQKAWTAGRAALAAAPVQAQEPFMYGIMGPDGKAHIDENCVGPDAESLYSELNGMNDSPDAGYAIVKLFTAPMQTQEPVAVVYPPDGTVSPFTVINLGHGLVKMGDSLHDGRLPALWFGKDGLGMGVAEEMNRAAKEGETLAVVTFSNVEGLDVLSEVVQRIRSASFPGAPVQPASLLTVTTTLTGHQLRMALDLINPGGPDERDELDDQLMFGIRQHCDDDGKVSTDMCCWNDDTDGVLPLDGEYEAHVASVQPVAVPDGAVEPTFMTEDQGRAWAWKDVKKDVGTEGWTAGDNGNYFGFFVHGWNYRGQFEKQRHAAPAAQGDAKELTDDEIVQAVRSVGVDTHPSKFGFIDEQIEGMGVTVLRQAIAAIAAKAAS